MAIILSIETATPVCSCALLRDGEVIINRESHQGQSHSTLLGVFVHDIMEQARQTSLIIDAIAISSGPTHIFNILLTSVLISVNF